MPRCLDPRVSFPLVLESDKGATESERATFRCKVLTSAERLAMWDAYEAATNEIDRMREDFKALRIAIVGWDQIEGRDGKAIPFDLAKLEQILSPDDAVELLNKAFVANSLDHEGKAKSASPLGSATPRSASDAGAGDARTSETSGPQCASSAQAAMASVAAPGAVSTAAAPAS